MAAGTPPFVSDDIKLLDRLIVETDVPGLSDTNSTGTVGTLPSNVLNVSARVAFPEDLAELLRLLLRKDPAQRPTWSELEAHRCTCYLNSSPTFLVCGSRTSSRSEPKL